MSQIFYGDGSSTHFRRPPDPQTQPAPAFSGDVITNRPGPKIFAPQVLLASGPVFALVQPVSHIVEAQPPADALHPLVEHHDFVSAGGDFLLVTIVILIAGWQFIRCYVPLAR